MLVSTPRGVTFPITVTFFVSKSMLNDVTPAYILRYGQSDTSFYDKLISYYVTYKLVWNFYLPFLKYVSLVFLHSPCNESTPSTQQPARIEHPTLKTTNLVQTRKSLTKQKNHEHVKQDQT